MNILHHFFAFFWWMFAMIVIQLGFYILVDFICTPIAFIFSGNFESLLQLGLEEGSAAGGILGADFWRLNTGLLGFDKILNWFLGLQYSVSGRWLMLVISGGICFAMLLISLFLDREIKLFSSSNPQNSDDIGAAGLLGLIVAHGINIPVIYGSVFGLLFLAVEFFN